MTSTSTAPRPARAVAPAAILALAFLVAACTSGASATVAPGGTTPQPPVSSSPPDGSTGSGESPADPPAPGGSDVFVVPKPGQLDVHPIAADSFDAQVDGRRVILTINYTSGVEPCSVLDTIVVQRADASFAITLREGHGPGDQVCIMIARFLKTQVDLGELDPGTYMISDTMRGADPIQVVVH
jgi:hypothetical protein